MTQIPKLPAPTFCYGNPVCAALGAAKRFHPGSLVVSLSPRQFGEGLTDAVITFADGMKFSRLMLLDLPSFTAFADACGFRESTDTDLSSGMSDLLLRAD